jgi:hypothetical protein
MEKDNKMQNIEEKIIRAQFDDKTIRVYQAFNSKIADEAAGLGSFGSSFKLDRMTWIKPSFLWMMYRSGWATKEGQERILAIDIKRTGFDTILENVVLSSFNSAIHDSYEKWKLSLESSNVRCQWDPDRDIYGNPLRRRAVQLGLKDIMVKNYVSDWIVKINDITEYVISMREAIKERTFTENMLPDEPEYPLDNLKKAALGIL